MLLCRGWDGCMFVLLSMIDTASNSNVLKNQIHRILRKTNIQFIQNQELLSNKTDTFKIQNPS